MAWAERFFQIIRPWGSRSITPKRVCSPRRAMTGQNLSGTGSFASVTEWPPSTLQPVSRLPRAPAPPWSGERRFDEGPGFLDRGGELCRLAASGLGHVGTTAALTTYFGGEGTHEIPGADAVGEVL